ncbi:hypothetical protein JST97_30110 [bacterium]|nr:hypothetical protein [bacterium]
MKTILSLALLWPGSYLAGAETIAKPPVPEQGHWVIVRETPSQNGRGQLKPTQPEARPWNRPTPLSGQTQRWNVRWEPNTDTPPVRVLKI